jgi:hypothetical protein
MISRTFLIKYKKLSFEERAKRRQKVLFFAFVILLFIKLIKKKSFTHTLNMGGMLAAFIIYKPIIIILAWINERVVGERVKEVLTKIINSTQIDR